MAENNIIQYESSHSLFLKHKCIRVNVKRLEKLPIESDKIESEIINFNGIKINLKISNSFIGYEKRKIKEIFKDASYIEYNDICEKLGGLALAIDVMFSAQVYIEAEQSDSFLVFVSSI